MIGVHLIDPWTDDLHLPQIDITLWITVPVRLIAARHRRSTSFALSHLINEECHRLHLPQLTETDVNIDDLMTLLLNIEGSLVVLTTHLEMQSTDSFLGSLFHHGNHRGNWDEMTPPPPRLFLGNRPEILLMALLLMHLVLSH